MNSSEVWQQPLCLLCGEFNGNLSKSLKEVTNFSGNLIEDVLASFIPLPLHNPQNSPSPSSICQNCFLKLNELDEHQVIAERIKSDLLATFNQIHPLSEFSDVKIKIEPEIEIPNFEDFNDFEYVTEDEPKVRKKSKIIEEVKVRKKRAYRKPLDETIEHKVEDGISSFECKLCGKVMKTRVHASNHAFNHKDIRNFCCQDCGMTFKLKSHLNVHRRIHTGLKNKMICDLCGKQFDQRFYIREHMEAIHLEIKKHACSVCNMIFARKRCLNKHYRVHQGETAKKIICEVCGFRSHTNYAMVRHSRSHTDERNFPCSICGKMFANKYNVTAHINSVHKGIRPVVDESKLRCSLCARKFPRYKQLRRHLYQVHQVMEHAAEFANEAPKLF